MSEQGVNMPGILEQGLSNPKEACQRIERAKLEAENHKAELLERLAEVFELLATKAQPDGRFVDQLPELLREGYFQAVDGSKLVLKELPEERRRNVPPELVKSLEDPDFRSPQGRAPVFNYKESTLDRRGRVGETRKYLIIFHPDGQVDSISLT